MPFPFVPVVIVPLLVTILLSSTTMPVPPSPDAVIVPLLVAVVFKAPKMPVPFEPVALIVPVLRITLLLLTLIPVPVVTMLPALLTALLSSRLMPTGATGGWLPMTVAPDCTLTVKLLWVPFPKPFGAVPVHVTTLPACWQSAQAGAVMAAATPRIHAARNAVRIRTPTNSSYWY